jgi:hypothetical protein
MHPSEGPLLTTVKVVFEAGDTPQAKLDVRARDSSGVSVGHYSGVFTNQGIIDSPAPTPPSPMPQEQAFVHAVLITDKFDLSRVGHYKVSWYLEGTLACSTLIEVY